MFEGCVCWLLTLVRIGNLIRGIRWTAVGLAGILACLSVHLALHKAVCASALNLHAPELASTLVTTVLASACCGFGVERTNCIAWRSVKARGVSKQILFEAQMMYRMTCFT